MVGLRKRYYAPSGADAHTMRRAPLTGWPMIVLGIETSCDETGVGHRPRRRPHHGAAGQRGRVLGRRARPLRRRGAGGRLPGAPVGDGARRAPGDGDGRGHRPRRRRRRRHRGPRPLRRAARRPRRGQGLRHGVGRAALRREPPRRARRRRHPAERPAARRASRCSSPVGTPACSTCRTSRARSRRSARRSTTRRARRSTRSPGCSGCRSRAARTSTGSPATATPRAVAFPRGLTGPRDAPFDFSFSGLKTAVARHVEALERAGTAVPVADVAASFQEAVVDVLTAKAVRAARERGMDVLLLGGGVAANSRLRALAAGALRRRRAHPARAAAGPVHGQRGDGRRAGRAPRRGGGEAQPAGPPGRLVPPGHAGAGGLTPRGRARCARTRAFTPQRSGAHQRRRPPGSR